MDRTLPADESCWGQRLFHEKSGGAEHDGKNFVRPRGTVEAPAIVGRALVAAAFGYQFRDSMD